MIPIHVCDTADIPLGSVKSFEVEGVLVAIYNIDGAFYATEATCTHGLADLASGLLKGDVIECWAHFGAFCVPTGKAVQSPCTVDLKTFRTEIRNSQVFVHLENPTHTASESFAHNRPAKEQP
jgi:nitrite reductase/ring-hydroxylating ferredoxin subunit